MAKEAPRAALLKEEENVGAFALLEGVQRPDEQEVFRGSEIILVVLLSYCLCLNFLFP